MTNRNLTEDVIKATRDYWKGMVSFVQRHKAPIATVVGLILGVVVGILWKVLRKEEHFSRREVMYVSFFGILYIRALQMAALPLIVVSIVSSLTSINLRFAEILGVRSLAFFLITTVLAVFWGIFLVLTIQPGKDAELHVVIHKKSIEHHTTLIDTLLDFVRSIFPDNYVAACIYSYETQLKPPMVNIQDENGNKITNLDGSIKQQIDNKISKYDWKIDFRQANAANYIGVSISSFVFGIAAIIITTSTQAINELFTALNDVTLEIVSLIMWCSPLAIFSLVCGKIIEEQHWIKFVGQIGWYSLTVITGIVTYCFIFLELVYFFITRKNPITFTCNMLDTLTTAFATSSSLATLPITLREAIQNNGIPAPVADFVIPLGATFNMNGTALYEAVASLFISQVLEHEITVLQIILTGIMASGASIGAAGIPQAGLVTIVMEFNLLNLDPETIVYIITVDWLMDRFQTVLNVFGDAVAAAVVVTFSKETFEEYQQSHLHPHYSLRPSPNIG